MADNTLQVRLQSAYKTETEWQATTIIPKVGEILYTKTGPHDGWYKVGNGTSVWSDLEYIKPSYNYNEIQPIKTKTYSGIYGSENNFANATFYFASLKPDSWTTTWRVKYRIYVTIPNQTYYTGWFDVEMWGNQATRLGYSIFNCHYSTSYRSLYFHVLYSLTSTGFNNGYGHLLGIGLRSSANPTSSSYPRTFKIDILAEENCTVTFNDTVLKYANVPGTGATNYNGYSEWNGCDNGLQETGDSNDTTTLQYATARLTAGSNGLPAYSITMMRPDGTWEGLTVGNATTATTSTKNSSGFVLGQMYIYWSGTNIAANGLAGTSTVRTAQDWVDMRYTLNCGTTLISNAMVYLKGTVINGLFYLDNTWWTQTLPTTADNFIYIPIGMCYGSGYASSFWGWHGAYYHDGTNLREYITNEATQAKSGLMSSADKTKLDGIATGANKYVLPIATSGAIGGVKSGTDITVDSSGNVSVVDNSHNHTIANVTNLQTSLDAKAPLASPTFTGTPKAPTATAGTNTTQVATTAFVKTAVDNATSNVEIGGRNLLYRKTQNGARTKNAIDYGITLTGENADTYFTLYLWEPLKQGEQYTISCEVEGLQEGTKYIYPLFGQGRSSLGALILDHNGKCSGVYTHDDLVIPTETVDNKIFYKVMIDDINRTISSGQGDIILSHFKLERGNKPTDWTPAPEDLVSDITLSGTTLSYKNPVGTQLGSYTLSKSNVGLGNVDNTSDVNKPISAATQNALDQLSAKVGNAKQFTGTCSSAADATAKVVTCTAFTADDLVKGTRISVYFDNTNSGAVGNLTLNVNSTGAKSIRYIYNGAYTTIPGTDYIRAGQIYNFTYDGTYWVVDMMYNTDADWKVRSDYGRYTAGTVGLFPYSLILQTPDGHWESIVTSSTVSANKAKNSHGFLLGSVFYKDGGASIQPGNVDSTWRFASNCVVDARYHFNIENTASKQLVSGNNVYLVGTIGTDGLFYLDDTWWSQSLPTSDDGKYYVYLGAVYTWYQYNLDIFHPIFKYSNNSVRQVSLDSIRVNGHTVEADVPSNAMFTDTVYTLPVATDSALGGVMASDDISVASSGAMLLNTFSYDFSYALTSSQATFTAALYRGTELITTNYDSDHYTWYKKTENGLEYLGSGYTYTLPLSEIAYVGSVVGRWKDRVDRYLTTVSGNTITTVSGNRLITNSAV